jgi:hypothetical protein
MMEIAKILKVKFLKPDESTIKYKFIEKTSQTSYKRNSKLEELGI